MRLPTLNFRRFAGDSAASNGKPTNIFLHGYLGSHKNFTYLSRHITKELNQPSIELDLRNHGLSHPHIDCMTYHEMAQDLSRFIALQGLERVNLIGYSMGAKIAQEYILNPGHHDSDDCIVEKIVCLDNSPMRLDNLGAEFQSYINLLTDLKTWIDSEFNTTEGKLTKDWRKRVLAYLQESDHLTNELSLYFLDLLHATKNNRVEFKINEYLLTQNCLEELNDFEDYSFVHPSKLPSLFIKAENSDFITTDSWKMISNTFSEAKLEVFSCDHKSLLNSDPERMKRILVEHLY